MDKEKQIEIILEVNNRIIKARSNDPNNYFKKKFNRFKLNKTIGVALTDYISGPSIPVI